MVMSQSVRLEARAAGVSRGLKEADDGNADMTNRNRIQGRLADAQVEPSAAGNRAMDRDARNSSGQTSR